MKTQETNEQIAERIASTAESMVWSEGPAAAKVWTIAQISTHLEAAHNKGRRSLAAETVADNRAPVA